MSKAKKARSCLKVQAIERGYFGSRVRAPGEEGDCFTLDSEDQFSEAWMIWVKDKKKAQAAKVEDDDDADDDDEDDDDFVPVTEVDSSDAKKIARAPKLFKDEKRGVEVTFDTAWEAAMLNFVNGKPGLAIADWNALKDADRRSRIQKEADRLLSVKEV